MGRYNDTDEFENDLAYFDEYPDEDPFAPKPTCTTCGGTGERLVTDDVYVKCYVCNGTGCQR